MLNRLSDAWLTFRVSLGDWVIQLGHIIAGAGIVLDAMDIDTLIDDRPDVLGPAAKELAGFDRTTTPNAYSARSIPRRAPGPGLTGSLGSDDD